MSPRDPVDNPRRLDAARNATSPSSSSTPRWSCPAVLYVVDLVPVLHPEHHCPCPTNPCELPPLPSPPLAPVAEPALAPARAQPRRHGSHCAFGARRPSHPLPLLPLSSLAAAIRTRASHTLSGRRCLFRSCRFVPASPGLPVHARPRRAPPPLTASTPRCAPPSSRAPRLPTARLLPSCRRAHDHAAATPFLAAAASTARSRDPSRPLLQSATRSASPRPRSSPDVGAHLRRAALAWSGAASARSP
nr:proline-rich protein 36-like [Aegilops tauschii subsp. strangulata]